MSFTNLVLAVSVITVLSGNIAFADTPAGTAESESSLKAEVVNCATVTPSVEVTVSDYTFAPMEAKIPVGSVVKWVNKGPTSHMITSGAPDAKPGAVFGTPFMGVGSTACIKFVNPGTYHYFCRPHGNAMKGGKVVVE